MKKKNTIKERNPLVVALARRSGAGAGAHQKPHKVNRKKLKEELKANRYDSF